VKITVITGSRGKIIGAFHGHASELEVVGQLYARPIPGPNQKFHEIEAPEDVFPETISAADAAQLPERLKRYLPRSPRQQGQRRSTKTHHRS
jgi:hypothetical protein